MIESRYLEWKNTYPEIEYYNAQISFKYKALPIVDFEYYISQFTVDKSFYAAYASNTYSDNCVILKSDCSSLEEAMHLCDKHYQETMKYIATKIIEDL